MLTIGFAYWTLAPYYNSYLEWEENQKSEMISTCKDSNDTKLCLCVNDRIFKEYTHAEYMVVDKNSSDYKEFIKETKEECLDDGWF